MPLAGAFFVVMLQLTLVDEGWPLRRLGRIAVRSGRAGLAWSIALTLYLLLVQTHPKSDSTSTTAAAECCPGAEFGAVLTAIGLWQVSFYVALRGWPFSTMTSRARATLARERHRDRRGVATYVILHGAIGLGPADGHRRARAAAHRGATARNAVRGTPALTRPSRPASD